VDRLQLTSSDYLKMKKQVFQHDKMSLSDGRQGGEGRVLLKRNILSTAETQQIGWSLRKMGLEVFESVVSLGRSRMQETLFKNSLYRISAGGREPYISVSKSAQSGRGSWKHENSNISQIENPYYPFRWNSIDRRITLKSENLHIPANRLILE